MIYRFDIFRLMTMTFSNLDLLPTPVERAKERVRESRERGAESMTSPSSCGLLFIGSETDSIVAISIKMHLHRIRKFKKFSLKSMAEHNRKKRLPPRST